MPRKSEQFSDNSPGSFAAWFRKCRKDRGLTAVEISRRAVLSAGYISDLERGKALPKKETVARIADAMDLAPAERAELQRRAFAQKPAKVAVPGLAIWREFPKQLFSKLGSAVEIAYVDDCFAQCVPAVASVLTWLHLSRNRISALEVVGLKAVARSAHEKTLAHWQQIGMSDQVAAENAAEIASIVAVTAAFRGSVFAESTRTAKLSDSIESWSFFPHGTLAPQIKAPSLSLQFNDEATARMYNFEATPCSTAAAAHQAMIAAELALRLDLKPHFWCPDALATALAVMLDPSSPLPRKAKASPGGRAWHDLYAAWCLAEFSLRLFVVPELGATVAKFGSVLKSLRDADEALDRIVPKDERKELPVDVREVEANIHRLTLELLNARAATPRRRVERAQ